MLALAGGGGTEAELQNRARVERGFVGTVFCCFGGWRDETRHSDAVGSHVSWGRSVACFRIPGVGGGYLKVHGSYLGPVRLLVSMHCLTLSALLACHAPATREVPWKASVPTFVYSPSYIYAGLGEARACKPGQLLNVSSLHTPCGS